MENIEERRVGHIPGADLSEVVDYLIEARERGEHIVYDFNGYDLHSDTVTLDSAYKLVCGCTKEEMERKEREMVESIKRREEENKRKAQEKIPEWIEKGNKLIYPERQEEWKKCVEARADDLYCGTDLEDALQIMNLLEQDASMAEIKQVLLDQGHSGFSDGVVKAIVTNFSKNGPRFAREIVDRTLSPDEEAYIKKIENENAEYEANQNKGKEY